MLRTGGGGGGDIGRLFLFGSQGELLEGVTFKLNGNDKRSETDRKGCFTLKEQLMKAPGEATPAVFKDVPSMWEHRVKERSQRTDKQTQPKDMALGLGSVVCLRSEGKPELPGCFPMRSHLSTTGVHPERGSPNQCIPDSLL